MRLQHFFLAKLKVFRVRNIKIIIAHISINTIINKFDLLPELAIINVSVYNILISIFLWFQRLRQDSNYLFRSDPRKCYELLQQLEDMGDCYKLPHWGFGTKMLSKCNKIVHSLTLFGVRYKQIVELEV